MRYTINKSPSSAVEIFINSTMAWDDTDRTTWAEVWDEDQRRDYMDEVVADMVNGIETASPSIYAMIQAVE
jgi:hypothetical protein